MLHSAGVGRTGTLITIDVELQRAQHDGAIDPFNFVLQMRNARNHMVQTEVRELTCSIQRHTETLLIVATFPLNVESNMYLWLVILSE